MWDSFSRAVEICETSHNNPTYRALIAKSLLMRKRLRYRGYTQVDVLATSIKSILDEMMTQHYIAPDIYFGKTRPLWTADKGIPRGTMVKIINYTGKHVWECELVEQYGVYLPGTDRKSVV